MSNRKKFVSLDDFINQALYNPKDGYYMKNNPFGSKGDFITAPNISILFSEMLAIWSVSFWQNLKSPNNINLIDLGAGNGQMIYDLINSFKNFPKFYNSCNFIILEKSPYLKKIQKKKLQNCKVKWLKKIKKINKAPTIFIGNEFFDSLPLKQFIKRNNIWFEKYVHRSSNNKRLIEKKININKFEKKIGVNLSKGQKFIEFSPLTFLIIKQISRIINKHNGGLLIIDYGYTNKKMYNTLQSVKDHKKTKILNYVSNSDITHKINYKFIEKIIKKFKLKLNGISTQGEFLTKLGIFHRAEIISKNLTFSKKADIYYRLKRLTDKKQMGELFKVMFASNKNINFKAGF